MSREPTFVCICAWQLLLTYVNCTRPLLNHFKYLNIHAKCFFVIPVILIPGKHSLNGGNINVYMKPVIDQLKQLWWPGVLANDHNIPPELTRRFKLRGCLMWTINDWPGFGLISGMVHVGYAGCPPCGPAVTSRYSRELHKCLYTDSWRWLRSRHHPYKRPYYIAAFGNKTES